MSQELELKKYKNRAHLCLSVAVVVFISAFFFPKEWGWIGDLTKIASESAMVGAFADWFAVTAIFKKIPIPLLSSHTEIIPKNKDKIADNLSTFIRDKFFDVKSIVELIRKHDPAQKISDWLVEKSNAERFGRYMVQFANEILNFIEDEPVQQFILKSFRTLIGKVDLSKTVGGILETLTKDGRHQALLDEGISKFAKVIQENEAVIERKIVKWLKDEHSFIETFLPTEWIGETGARIAVNIISTLLNEINNDINHVLRKDFDNFTEAFIKKLKTDPQFIAKGEEIKGDLQNDPTLNTYLKELWGDLRNWLKADLNSDNSILYQKIVAGSQWVGKSLADDENLRESLNNHLEESAKNMAPDFAQFLTKHISETVKNWDSKEMSRQIELNIGKDLQWIRINGTIIGGLIGVLLYFVSQIPSLL